MKPSAGPTMEHRRHPRLPLHAPIILQTRDGREYRRCRISDFSHEGLSVVCEDETPPPRGFIQLTLPLPDQPPQRWPRCQAQIVHHHGNRLGIWLGDSAMAAHHPLTRYLQGRIAQSPT